MGTLRKERKKGDHSSPNSNMSKFVADGFLSLFCKKSASRSNYICTECLIDGMDFSVQFFSWSAAAVLILSHFPILISSNAKPCPKCGQTMEKRDGCNKVQCAKCTYECCWLCLQGWSKHPMCNRFVETGNEDLRFLHFYLRYKNHSNSRAMEDKVIKNEINR